MLINQINRVVELIMHFRIMLYRRHLILWLRFYNEYLIPALNLELILFRPSVISRLGIYFSEQEESAFINIITVGNSGSQLYPASGLAWISPTLVVHSCSLLLSVTNTVILTLIV